MKKELFRVYRVMVASLGAGHLLRSNLEPMASNEREVSTVSHVQGGTSIRWADGDDQHQHHAMRRAFEAMHSFAVGDEEPLYVLTLNDAGAVAFILRLHPEYPIDWVRDPRPGEVVPPDRILPNGKMHCCRTVGDIQHSIHVLLARDAARAAAAEALRTDVPCHASGATASEPASNLVSATEKAKRGVEGERP